MIHHCAAFHVSMRHAGGLMLSTAFKQRGFPIVMLNF